VLRTKQPVHIIDVTAEPAYAEREPARVAAVELAKARTFLAVPMLKENELLGIGDDRDAPDDLLRKFRQTAISTEREIQDASRSGNLAMLTAAAHKLSGAAPAIGVGEVASAAGVIERARKAGDRAACRDLVGRLTVQLRRVFAEIPETSHSACFVQREPGQTGSPRQL
jgi:hypothetical protein